MTEFTDDQILEGISDAIENGNLPIAADLIKLLALQNPDAAQKIYDAVVHRKVTVEVPLEASA